jgi:hypothetical protein
VSAAWCFEGKIIGFIANLQEKLAVIENLCKERQFKMLILFIGKNKALVEIAVENMQLNNRKLALKLIVKHQLFLDKFSKMMIKANNCSIRYHLEDGEICMLHLIEAIKNSQSSISLVLEMLAARANSEETWKFSIVRILQSAMSDGVHIIPQWLHNKLPTKFAPIDLSTDLILRIPRDSVFFISSPSEIQEIRWTGRYIGLDTEWRPNLIRSDNNKVSILQVALEDRIYIFDVLSLHPFPDFNGLLHSLFESETVKLGVGFHADIAKLTADYPNLTCFKNEIKNYTEISDKFSEVYKQKTCGLAGICEKIFGKRLSKFEQMSNWENRPLREAQLHYAALDAYILIEVFERMMEDQKSLRNSGTGMENGEGIKCKTCGSKGHKTEDCDRGYKCRVCGRFGHCETECKLI